MFNDFYEIYTDCIQMYEHYYNYYVHRDNIKIFLESGSCHIQGTPMTVSNVLSHLFKQASNQHFN